MNIGTGFLAFQATIEIVVEDLKEPKLWPAVSDHFIKCLEVEMRIARNLPSYGGLPYSTFWTMATSSEYDAARSRAQSTLTVPASRLSDPVIAEAPWRDIVMRQRASGTVYAEGTQFRLSVGHRFDGHWRYDSKQRRDVEQFQISLAESFYSAVKGSYYGSKPKTTHAKSQDAADKALRRMVKDFYTVELVSVKK